MPQPITHYLVAKKAVRNTLKELWRQYSNFVGFGSFAPDLFYMKDIGYFWTDTYSYMSISDIMHWEGSYSFFCSMLNYTKNDYLTDKSRFDKLKAFIYGYYSHVVTDVVFHPFVYRRSQDHWKSHLPNENYIEHKRLEAIIDSFLVNSIEQQNPYQFQYYDKILCYQDNNNKTLDNDIFLLLNSCLKDVYKSICNNAYLGYLKNGRFEDYFDNYSITDSDHPIHEAYDDYADNIKELYTFRFLSLIPVDTLQALVPIKKINPEQKEKLNLSNDSWFGNHNVQPKYSVIELYKMSVNATKKVILNAELFFASDDIDSRVFFDRLTDKSVFLSEDINLDTGIICANNIDTNLLSDDESIRFDSFLVNIEDDYRSIA